MAPVTRSKTRTLSPNTLVKCLRSSHTHHGFTYKLGLNVCPDMFNREECRSGGLYGCRLKDLLLWISLYHDIDTVAIVEIPPTAQTAWFPTKFKASELIITRFIPLVEAVTLSLKHGGDMHMHTDNTSLSWAVENGHLEVVRLLKEYGEKDDALILAAHNGHTGIVQFLIDPTTKPATFERICTRAATRGHIAIVKLLLDYGVVTSSTLDASLCYASMCGFVNIVRLLLDHGADVHINHDDSLRWAVGGNYLDIVQLLLDRGADVNAQHGTPLTMAIKNNITSMVELLLERGADPFLGK
jgi:ankyrin repeat protein